jgi:predicted small metal-binding protein
MYKVACKDLGIKCDFTVMSASADEVKRGAMEHARRVHADFMQQMTANPAQMAEMEKVLAKAIKTVAPVRQMGR